MKSILFSVLIIAAAVAVSCGSGSRSGITESGLVEIDVSAEYPAEEIVLQTVADVEYVPLATSKEVLLSPSDRLFYLSDRYIMVHGRRTGNICVFDRMGRIVSHFNRQGRGPGEYNMIRDIVFDEEIGELFVVENAVGGEIEVYSLAGEHKRTLPLSKGWQINIWSIDGNTLLAYDEGGVAIGKEYGTMPYHLISKADGTIVETLGIEMPVRYSSMSVKTSPGENGRVNTFPIQMALTNNRLGGKDFTLADMSSDTVYTYSHKRILTPAFVRTPSVHASEPRVVWGMELVKEDFVVFEVQTLDFDSALAGSYPPIRSLKYDYATGHTTEVKFTDANNSAATWSNYGKDVTESPANTAVQMLDPLKLTEAYEKGELSGPLAETAATLKEDDNPVVMIVKFR